MTTSWGEAFLNATHTVESDGEKPTQTAPAEDAGSASHEFAIPALSGAKCLNGRLPEWPETAVYVYL